ncbi:hypothetical protein KIW84_061278 [Lathyrus oleraceus]|uniref:Uncharacterized protein n=1 Tax=Pisum sativum TaxID=3888 RepID=A0A9D4W3S0_PEA|nr:hypothetical protein KIW84_061278 [Pisum sativum]
MFLRQKLNGDNSSGGKNQYFGEYLQMQSLCINRCQTGRGPSAAARFFSLLEVCRRNKTTVLCTAAAEHENHPILSPSASIRAVAVAPAAMSESDHSEHSAADTHKSAADTHKYADTWDFGQAKNTTFRGSKSEFHPALVVSNIRNYIPIFRIHARSHRVLHHIVPSIGKEPPAITDANHEQ